MVSIKQTKRIVFDALLSALFFVLSLLSLDLGSMKFTFDGIAALIAGFLFSPVDGAIVGLLGAFLEQMLKYGFTPTTVLWILPAALRGLIAGLAVINASKVSIKRIIITVIVSSLAVTTLNTIVWYIDSLIYGYYSFETVFGNALVRYFTGVCTAVIMAVVLPPLLTALEKFMKQGTHKYEFNKTA